MILRFTLYIILVAIGASAVAQRVLPDNWLIQTPTQQRDARLDGALKLSNGDYVFAVADEESRKNCSIQRWSAEGELLWETHGKQTDGYSKTPLLRPWMLTSDNELGVLAHRDGEAAIVILDLATGNYVDQIPLPDYSVTAGPKRCAILDNRVIYSTYIDLPTRSTQDLPYSTYDHLDCESITFPGSDAYYNFNADVSEKRSLVYPFDVVWSFHWSRFDPSPVGDHVPEIINSDVTDCLIFQKIARYSYEATAIDRQTGEVVSNQVLADDFELRPAAMSFLATRSYNDTVYTAWSYREYDTPRGRTPRYIVLSKFAEADLLTGPRNPARAIFSQPKAIDDRLGFGLSELHYGADGIYLAGELEGQALFFRWEAPFLAECAVEVVVPEDVYDHRIPYLLGAAGANPILVTSRLVKRNNASSRVEDVIGIRDHTGPGFTLQTITRTQGGNPKASGMFNFDNQLLCAINGNNIASFSTYIPVAGSHDYAQRSNYVHQRSQASSHTRFQPAADGAIYI